jgi:hypothetical protein
MSTSAPQATGLRRLLLSRIGRLLGRIGGASSLKGFEAVDLIITSVRPMCLRFATGLYGR